MISRPGFIPLLAVLACACGPSKEDLLRDADSCRKELSSNQYMVNHLKEELGAMRKAAETPVEEEPPLPLSVQAWEEAFVDISERMRLTLTDVQHSVRVEAGTLIVAIPAKEIFAPGSDTLGDDGSAVVHKAALVLETLDQRDILVTCRASDVTLVKKNPKVTTNRELALQRALAVSASLEWRGVDPAHLVAGGYNADPATGSEGEGGSTDADLTDIGVVEFHILPLPEELPDFPPLS